jgi:aspartate racemase
VNVVSVVQDDQGNNVQANEKLRIGVLGGMGPAATIDFMAKVRAATPALHDQDHVPLIVYCVPQIPDRSTAVLAGTDATIAASAGRRARCCRTPVCTPSPLPATPRTIGMHRCRRQARVPILHIADAVRRVDCAARSAEPACGLDGDTRNQGIATI